MNANDSYFTLHKSYEGLYKEKGSKFLAFALPCDNEEKAKEILQQFRKEHHTAVHVCFAWRFGLNAPYLDRYSDDGEPANSAGKPIFGQIIAFDLTNVLVAVVRYYGGTKLGVGGLINAYKSAVKDALDKAKIVEEFVQIEFESNYEYENTGSMMSIIEKLDGKIIDQKFEIRPYIRFSIRKSYEKQLHQLLKEYHELNLKKLT